MAASPHSFGDCDRVSGGSRQAPPEGASQEAETAIGVVYCVGADTPLDRSSAIQEH